jgi:hypothetical protein
MFHVEHFPFARVGRFHVEQIIPPVREIRNGLIARLNLCLGEINRAPQEPRRRARLQPAEFQSHLSERGGNTHCSGFAGTPARLLILANVHEAL